MISWPSIKKKVDRVIKLAKAARTEMVQLSTGDLELEEQVNHESNQFQIIIKKVTFSVDQLLWAARQSDRVLGTSERM